jgi:hypothetical protein
MAAGLADGSAAALQYSSADPLNLTYDGILRSRSGNRTVSEADISGEQAVWIVRVGGIYRNR